MSFDTLPNQSIINKTAENLKQNHMEVIMVETAAQALAQIKTIIPKNASVMNGASKTLEQIGFTEYLKSDQHPWHNLHTTILSEQDPVKQAVLRKQATISDYYLGSVHALTQDGNLLIASNTGSQLPNIAYNSTNLIFVVGTQKIVANLDEALARLEKHVIPLEDERMQQVYGVGTFLSKILIFKGELPFLGRKVTIILVNEKLGY